MSAAHRQHRLSPWRRGASGPARTAIQRRLTKGGDVQNREEQGPRQGRDKPNKLPVSFLWRLCLSVEPIHAILFFFGET